MFSRRLQQVISKISLMLMIFASLAPSVSYALASQANPQLFQQICSSGVNASSVNTSLKKVVLLQVVTTKGQQLSTAFSINPTTPPPTNNMGGHFEHCPFCASHMDAVVAPNISHVLFVAQLNAYQLIATYSSPLTQRFYQRANPQQAPPYPSIY